MEYITVQFEVSSQQNILTRTGSQDTIPSRITSIINKIATYLLSQC